MHMKQRYLRPRMLSAAIVILCCSLCGYSSGDSAAEGAKPVPKAENALSNRIERLVVSPDSETLLALTTEALFVLDALTQSQTEMIAIRDKGDGSELSAHWSARNMAMSPDRGHALVLDRYLDLATGRPKVTLDVAHVIKRGNPSPRALDISPAGELGLLFVDSFYAAKYNALAVYDLSTGELIHSRETGETVANAIFTSEAELMIIYA